VKTPTLQEIDAAFGSDVQLSSPPPLRNPNFVPIGTAFGFLVYIEDIKDL
jgi:hypothetical protein